MSATPEPTGVTVHRDGPIAHLRLDGAARLNAIGTNTCAALAAAVHEIDADRGIRAVVVEGPGRAFCAGADIAEIAGFDEPADFARFVHGFTDALELIERSPVPFVAAISGPAFGGGLELALACDLRVTAREVPLGLPEAKLGVLPGAGGTVRLPRLVPRGIAYEMLVRGTPITGERGHQLGLINVLCEAADEVPAAAVALAQELTGGAPLVPDRAKSLLREAALLDVHDGIERERRIATELFASEDGREGFAAFVARRPATFGRERT
jgi:enoyl-CoA hydratase/carnithine racemase